jgi:hypothetical protein
MRCVLEESKTEKKLKDYKNSTKTGIFLKQQGMSSVCFECLYGPALSSD